MAVGVDRLEVLLITKPPAQPTTHHTAADPQGAVEGGGSRSEGGAASDEYAVPAVECTPSTRCEGGAGGAGHHQMASKNLWRNSGRFFHDDHVMIFL